MHQKGGASQISIHLKKRLNFNSGAALNYALSKNSGRRSQTLQKQITVSRANARNRSSQRIDSG